MIIIMKMKWKMNNNNVMNNNIMNKIMKWNE